MPEVTLGPDETKTVWVEFQLYQKANVTNDWSVTAWGESGTVEVTLDGETTDHFPYIGKLESDGDGNDDDEDDDQDDDDEIPDSIYYEYD